MSSTIVSEQPVKTQTKSQRKNSTFSMSSQKKFKHDRSGRKRTKSFSGGCGKIKNSQPVLPSKFLLGGNINDPLNLNSLQDEEINRAMNAVTPKSSPIPTPPRRRGQVEVIIPSNLNDPLHLIDCADDAEYEQQLYSPVKKGRKKRSSRKRRTTSGNLDNSDADMSGTSEAKTPETNKDSAKIPEESEVPTTAKPKDLTLELSPKKDKNKRKSEEHKDNVKKIKYSMDKIVSPVVPQPGAWLKRSNGYHWNMKLNRQQHKEPGRKMPQFKEKNKQFQFGNYNRYYGYRNPQNEIDPRLRCFSQHPYLFEGKDILDVGCNIGHITLSVARDFGAKSIVGIDIDKKLIGIARKNVKHYVSSDSPPQQALSSNSCSSFNEFVMGKDGFKKSSEFFPISMPILYGPIDIPGFCDQTKGQGFPNNVTFVQGNYVLDDDTLLNIEQPQFDVILCLSITKWIHLNWGDLGIKRAFKRMYAQLRPGGKLLLEPQNWASYKTKKNLTETIFKHFNTIELFPENFTQYLLSPEVGFAKSEILGFPHHPSKGFQRPIQVYTKSTVLLSERIESSQANIDTKKVYVPTPVSNSSPPVAAVDATSRIQNGSCNENNSTENNAMQSQSNGNKTECACEDVVNDCAVTLQRIEDKQISNDGQKLKIASDTCVMDDKENLTSDNT